MPVKRDMDATTGTKLLKLFQRLMLDGRRHFLSDLAEWLNCSRQTVMRLAGEIENAIGANLRTGLEDHRRWYQICSSSYRRLGLETEELRYLSICRELADPYLPRQVSQRLDNSIFRFALDMADTAYMHAGTQAERRFAFYGRGRIDYTPHFAHIRLLMRAQDERRLCLVEYKAAGQAESREHRFAPGRMASMNNALYVLGADVNEDFQTLRHFTNLAVHRICNVTLTDRPALFSFLDSGPDGFGLPWHEPRVFRIRFAPGKASDYIRERVWAEEQQLEELEDGGVLLTITTRSEPEVLAWVRSFGEAASLLES